MKLILIIHSFPELFATHFSLTVLSLVFTICHDSIIIVHPFTEWVPVALFFWDWMASKGQESERDVKWKESISLNGGAVVYWAVMDEVKITGPLPVFTFIIIVAIKRTEHNEELFVSICFMFPLFKTNRRTGNPTFSWVSCSQQKHGCRRLSICDKRDTKPLKFNP